MARNPEQKTNTLAELGTNKLLLTKVITMLDSNRSYSEIIEFLDAQDFSLSKATITNFSKKLDDSRSLGIPIQQLLDKRIKSTPNDIAPEKIVGYVGDDTGHTAITDREMEEIASNLPDSDNVTPTQVANAFYSVDSVLEQMIKKGMATLQNTNFLDVNVLMKALELYTKTHGAQENNGLTIDAMKQYQLITEAKMKAYFDIIMTYIPEDKQEEAVDRMEETQREMLQSIQATPQGTDLINVLKKAGIDL